MVDGEQRAFHRLSTIDYRLFGGNVAKTAKENRIVIHLACEECKRRNYATTKNRRNDPDRLTLNKYCRWCRCRRAHRETK